MLGETTLNRLTAAGYFIAGGVLIKATWIIGDQAAELNQKITIIARLNNDPGIDICSVPGSKSIFIQRSIVFIGDVVICLPLTLLAIGLFRKSYEVFNPNAPQYMRWNYWINNLNLSSGDQPFQFVPSTHNSHLHRRPDE